MKRIILHSDMNACYASIEAKLNPSLKGKPMAVAGNPKNRNGIIPVSYTHLRAHET